QTIEQDSPIGFRLERFDGKSFDPFFEPKGDWRLGNELTLLRTTEDGGIWVGGQLGLGVWDNKTKTFTQTTAVPQGRAVELLEAGKGKIWYTTGDVISEFNGRTWSVIRFAAGQIHAMMKARDGGIWVASNNGLHRFA